MDEKVLDKIKKLLALGQSDNPNEAAEAMKKARELMQQNQVSMQDVELSSIGEYMVSMANMSEKQPAWHVMLINIVAGSFGVEPLIAGYKGNPILKFIGLKNRIEVAAYCYTVLSRKIVAERKHFISTLSKRMKTANKTIKGDVFCRGWVLGVADNVSILARDDRERQLIDEYMEKQHPDRFMSKSRPAKKNAHLDALIAGMAAGSDEQIHHGVDGSKPQMISHAQ
jgi:hypothetical protein